MDLQLIIKFIKHEIDREENALDSSTKSTTDHINYLKGRRDALVDLRDVLLPGNRTIYKEKANMISEKPVWVFIYDCWLYSDESLLKLCWIVFKEWKNNRHLVG